MLGLHVAVAILLQGAIGVSWLDYSSAGSAEPGGSSISFGDVFVIEVDQG